jgi:hypothetical protein
MTTTITFPEKQLKQINLKYLKIQKQLDRDLKSVSKDYANLTKVISEEKMSKIVYNKINVIDKIINLAEGIT